MIRKRTRTHETDTEGTTQVQTHETEPGMHRVASCDLLANAVEDLGGGDALCPRAENLSETTVQLQDKVAPGVSMNTKFGPSVAPPDLA